MRLWALALATALLVSGCAAAAAAIGDRIPTMENDHLLDGVPGIGGPR